MSTLSETLLKELREARERGWEPSLILTRRRGPRRVMSPEEALKRDSARLRKRRLFRRLGRYASGEFPTRCQWEGCHNLLRFQGNGKPPRYCSKVFHSSYYREVEPEERWCEASGCTTLFRATGKKRACSNACRQRAWYHRSKKRG